jgi:hypothetical protein
MGAVGFGAGDGKKQEARFDLAAVGGNAGDIEASVARIDLRFRQQLAQPHRVSFALASSN